MKRTAQPAAAIKLIAASLVLLSACDSVEDPTAVIATGSPRFLVGSAAQPERPFRGRIRGHVVAHPTSDPIIWTGGAQAAGNGTHVGSFTKATSDVVNLATGATTGTFIMTVASGDHVTGRYSGFVILGSSTGTLSWVLDAIVTGGTGRFSHASGAFVFVAEGTYTIVGGVFHSDYTETFEGHIKY